MTVESLTPQDEKAPEAAEGPATSTPEAPATEGPFQSQEAGQAAESETPMQAEDKPKRGRPKGATTARKTRTVELTLTVTGTADGDWQAELKHGSKWVARGLEIPAAAVSRAAKELHDDLSGAIDEVINAAREQQQAKVAELEAELERAKQALSELQS
jgi:hypothetical protein